MSDYAAVTALRHLVEKSAKEWYRANVRDKEEAWDVECLMDALFDDTFPFGKAMVQTTYAHSASSNGYYASCDYAKILEGVSELPTREMGRERVESRGSQSSH